ncbi:MULTISPECIES: PEP-CTERM sorting domain-containing protein [unclassified Agarivorans]|uniref:PEP-CTERM sorting domain-containing protein n=1 Tax=unclassified Agarivorans TaxID=2636026 RepID=UPI003D7D9583
MGFINAPFNKIQVREQDGATHSNEYFQLYTLSIGTSSVPEPQTILLMALALIFLGGFRLKQTA